MNKTAAATLAVLAVLTTAACSKLPGSSSAEVSSPEQLKARCNEQPQWLTKDDKGQDIGIYVCFGEKSQLLYTVRVLKPAVDPAVAAAQAENEKLRAELAKALEQKKAPASAPAPKSTEPKK